MTRREVARWAAGAGVALAVPSVLLHRWDSGGSRAPSARRRPAAPGALPEDGRPELAGLELPEGTQRRPVPVAPPGKRDVAVGPTFWSTVRGDERAFELATLLAMAFPRTGLWPCLWLHWDEPESYCEYGPRAVADVHPGSARSILADEWSRHPLPPSARAPFGSRFPGLAPRAQPRETAFEPFAALASEQRRYAEWDPEALRPRLMLVPCREPMDTIALLGFTCGTTYGGVENPALVSSVLRSWQERFSVTLVGLAPRAVVVAVGAPPRDFDHALRITPEHYAFAPRDDARMPGAFARDARELLGGRPPSTQMSRDLWTFGWDE